jgi:hypothetical protein
MPRNRSSKWVTLAVASLALTPAFAKDDRPILPQYILNAHTVAVLIEPDAGIAVSDPNANQTAQRDVEAALLKWGRFNLVLSTANADLVIVLRKGHGKVADATISDPRQNSRPGSVTRTDNGISIGVQHGTPPPGTQGTSTPADGSGSASPRAEAGNPDDSFQVFEGKIDEDPTAAVPGWQWIHKNGLHAHDVPAVDEFRKAVAEAEKQAAQRQGKHP